MTAVHDPGGLGYRIESVYAYLSIAGDGLPGDLADEGVIGAQIGGTFMPLVGADLERVEALRPYAEAAARASGRPVVLARFDRRTDLDRLEPR